jgi:hypothetical protein
MHLTHMEKQPHTRHKLSDCQMQSLSLTGATSSVAARCSVYLFDVAMAFEVSRICLSRMYCIVLVLNWVGGFCADGADGHEAACVVSHTALLGVLHNFEVVLFVMGCIACLGGHR